MKMSNLLDAEFKTLLIKMLSELSENFNSVKKGMKTIKNNQSEMKDTITEIKNNLQGINNKVDEAKNQNIRKQKTTNQNGKKKKQIQKDEDRVRILQDNFKCTNICIIGVLGEEKDQEIGNLFEKMVKENFRNLVKEIDIQV